MGGQESAGKGFAAGVRRRDPGRLPLGNFVRAGSAFAIAFIVFYTLFLLPLPYYIFKAGSAEELRPMVHVRQGDSPERGAFLLTTVGVMDSNVFSYVWGRLTGEEIHRKSDILQQGETDQEYTQRQAYQMLTSQSSAIQAAYRQLGVPYHITDDGMRVIHILPGMPAAKVLQPGDELMEIEGRPVSEGAAMTELLKGKKAGETVRITYKRGDAVRTEGLQLADFPVSADTDPGDSSASAPPAQVGFGFTYAELQSVVADQPDKQVTVKAGDIGEPSAGLMFSLEICNQLVPDDITKGYRIAGTGEIDDKGNVGVIGGIRHKVAAADREKADIFFTPKDRAQVPEAGGQAVLNTTDAVDAARKLGSRMKIVSVGSLSEAIDYLQSLPPKPQAPEG